MAAPRVRCALCCALSRGVRSCAVTRRAEQRTTHQAQRLPKRARSMAELHRRRRHYFCIARPAFAFAAAHNRRRATVAISSRRSLPDAQEPASSFAAALQRNAPPRAALCALPATSSGGCDLAAQSASRALPAWFMRTVPAAAANDDVRAGFGRSAADGGGPVRGTGRRHSRC